MDARALVSSALLDLGEDALVDGAASDQLAGVGDCDAVLASVAPRHERVLLGDAVVVLVAAAWNRKESAS